MDYHVPLFSDNMYHIVGSAVGSEKLFTSSYEYESFLQKFDKYINPVADTYAYTLLPNHFHFLSEIKPYDTLLELYKQKKPAGKIYDTWQPEFVMKQFSNMLNSYAKSFNFRYERKGSLFLDYLRRVEVQADSQFTATIFYIHKNPVHHGYCKHISDWPWSSFNTILSDSPTKIKREKVIEWFGSAERFADYHNQPIYLKNAIRVE